MDLHDVQGLVFHAYRSFPYAAYVLLRFEKRRPAAVQRWLGDLVEDGAIDSAKPDESAHKYPDVRLNVALSASGLEAIGLDEGDRQTFPLTFLDGLGREWPHPEVPDHRSRILGDVAGDNRPFRWNWGYQRESRVDALLLVFANDEAILGATVRGLVDHAIERGAINCTDYRVLHGAFPPDMERPREAFGFVDGISQPVLKGGRAKLGRKDRQPDINEIEDGEIVLGYRDNTRMLPRTPSVAPDRDPHRLLRDVPSDPGTPKDPSQPNGEPPRRDLGFNGTYLVFRQLEQNVDAFNDACRRASRETGIPEDRFGAMLLGRWKDGSPLIKCPIAHDEALATVPAANDFAYRSDPNGERCPIGAHVRRANPRDSLGDDPEESLRVTRRHRILRRGRPYRMNGTSGLHFIGLNADIARQFEFIQQNWINDATFGGLDGEDDPVVGARVGRAVAGVMTLPPRADNPARVRQRFAGLASYITVRGGGYFFLPGLTALRFLAGMGPVEPKVVAEPAPAIPTARDRVRQLFLSRFSILLGAVLALSPFLIAGNPRVVTFVRPVFLLSRRLDMLVVSAAASLAAAVTFLTYRLVQLYAKRRFDVVTLSPFTLKWRHVWAWQLLSLPIVSTALWMTASDVANAPLLSWSFARQLWLYSLAAAAGYAVAFLVLFIAAAAREKTVGPDYPEGIALLPPSRILRRFKSEKSPVAGSGKFIVDYVQGHAGTWPTHRGAGYVDHGTGRILPGHLASLMLFLLIASVYWSATSWLRPPTPRFQMPPLAYVILLLMAGGWAASAAAFFLDRYRFPLMTALGGVLLLAVIVGGTDHEFAVLNGRLRPAPSIASVIASADAYDRDHGGTDSANRPVIVVAAGGGGLHQAAWTVRVLAGLTELWGQKFAGNLRLVSAVSGGSVGTMYFLNGFTDAGLPRAELPRIVDRVKRSVNGDVWWGFAYPDLRRSLSPFPNRLIKPTIDRAWALEQGWVRELGPADEADRTMDKWQEGVERGWRPSMAFNSLAVENGDRAVLATYRVPPTAATIDLTTITGGQDIAVVTAARLSAAFPYITPFARAQKVGDANTKMDHFADGGYWDNHAVVSALEWITEALPAIGTRKILLVQIPPLEVAPMTSADQPWVWQQIAPLAAFDSMRTNAQRSRNDIELSNLKGTLKNQLAVVELPYSRGSRSNELLGSRSKDDFDAPLSWHLSRREKSAIDALWQDTYLPRDSDALKRIACVLGPDDAGVHLPSGCPQ